MLSGEPAADALEIRLASEHPQRHREGRVELMQVPAQPLMRTSALVDDRVSVIDQQFQLTKRLLVRTRSAQPRLAQSGTRDRERIDRVRLPAASAGTALGRHQLRWHPHQLLTRGEQLPLKPTSQASAILKRPQPLL